MVRSRDNGRGDTGREESKEEMKKERPKKARIKGRLKRWGGEKDVVVGRNSYRTYISGSCN